MQKVECPQCEREAEVGSHLAIEKQFAVVGVGWNWRSYGCIPGPQKAELHL